MVQRPAESEERIGSRPCLGEVSRVRRRVIREYSPGIGFPHPLSVVVILYHICDCESERFVKFLQILIYRSIDIMSCCVTIDLGGDIV